jgi:hypothetical protein
MLHWILCNTYVCHILYCAIIVCIAGSNETSAGAYKSVSLIT